MLKIVYSSRFKKDFKKIKKRGYDISKIEKVFNLLSNEQALPQKYQDHPLTGNFIGFRECHIEPDWLLVYKIENEILTLTLTRTGTHSDIFNI